MGAWQSYATGSDPSSQVPPTPPPSPAVPDSTQAQPSGQTVLPQSAGYNTDIASSYPAAYPTNGAPGSTTDLENRAQQSFQQPAPQQQQPQQPQSFSDDNPWAKNVKYFQDQLDQLPPPATGGGVKRVLQNFFSGMGGSMMAAGGLTPPDVRRQQLQNMQQHALTGAGQWEEAKSMMRYRDVLAQGAQQNQQFESQMQPLRIQEAQQAVTAGAQNASTVHPAMSAADLKSLGVPDDLAAQYQGHQLTSADFAALKDLSAAGATRIFDYGQDGSGNGKGQWLVDRNYNPIKQLSPISEAGRATSLAKLQAQQQQALIKGMNAPVYAYDPQQKATVLTTQTQAQQSGMQSIRGVKETDIRNDTHDTRVLNDVAVKSNNLLDASAALDQNQNQRDMITWAMSQADRDNQFRAGAFGTSIPTGWLNTLLNSSNLSGASQLTKDYVVANLSLREAAMGMQKVLTGSARANESQINALMATVPGLETNSALARQKLAAFTQNVDMLRQGIPRMPGIDTVPIRSTPQKGIQQTTGAAGFNWSNYPVAGAPQ